MGKILYRGKGEPPQEEPKRILYQKGMPTVIQPIAASRPPAPPVFAPFDRTLGTSIVGGTGMGKTALLHQLINTDLLNGTTAIVFDVHGDLTQDVLSSLPAGVQNRVSVLSVDNDYPFGLNLYEKSNNPDRDIDTIVTIFRRLWGDERNFYPRIEYVLRNTGRTIQANRGFTMAEVPDLFYNERLTQYLLQNVDNPAVHLFWHDYHTRRPFDKTALIESTLNKLDMFLSSATIRNIVSQEKTTIHFEDFLNRQGQLLLIHLPIGTLGEIRSEFLGVVLLSLLLNAVYSRPQGNRPLVNLYLDEYARLSTPATASFLREGRKFGVGTTVCFQNLDSLDPENKSAVLQTGTKIIFKTIGNDAEVLSKHFTIQPEYTDPKPQIKVMPNGENGYIGERKIKSIPMFHENKDRTIEAYDWEIDEGQLYDIVPGTARSYSDMQTELAIELATLPRFTCYIQYLDHAGELQQLRLTTKQPPDRTMTQDIIRDILLRSRAQFGTPVSEVKERAAARIAPFLKQPEEEEQPDTNQTTSKPKPKPKPPISGAKPFP